MKILRTISIFIFIGFLFLIYQNIMAFKDGIVGFTKKNGNDIGCVCHEFEPNDTVNVNITGPSVVRANDTALYVLKISKGPAIAGGCDISTSLGNVITTPLDTGLRRDEQTPGAGFELTHKRPKLFTGDSVEFIFRYIAPSTPNVTDTIFANGNSTNNNVSSDGDKWNYASNFLVSIIPPSGIAANSSIIRSFELEQNYPNPFNPETKINFNITNSSVISLVIYNIEGKEAATLINNSLYRPGNYSLTINADQYKLSSGVYYYKLTTKDGFEVKKMVFIK